MQSRIVKMLTVEFVGIFEKDLQRKELIFAANVWIAAKIN